MFYFLSFIGFKDLRRLRLSVTPSGKHSSEYSLIPSGHNLLDEDSMVSFAFGVLGVSWML
jgi:hypothetical protein